MVIEPIYQGVTLGFSEPHDLICFQPHHQVIICHQVILKLPPGHTHPSFMKGNMRDIYIYNNRPFINACDFQKAYEKCQKLPVQPASHPVQLAGQETLLHATASGKRDNPDRPHLQNKAWQEGQKARKQLDVGCVQKHLLLRKNTI